MSPASVVRVLFFAVLSCAGMAQAAQVRGIVYSVSGWPDRSGSIKIQVRGGDIPGAQETISLPGEPSALVDDFAHAVFCNREGNPNCPNLDSSAIRLGATVLITGRVLSNARITADQISLLSPPEPVLLQAQGRIRAMSHASDRSQWVLLTLSKGSRFQTLGGGAAMVRICSAGVQGADCPQIPPGLREGLVVNVIGATPQSNPSVWDNVSQIRLPQPVELVSSKPFVSQVVPAGESSASATFEITNLGQSALRFLDTESDVYGINGGPDSLKCPVRDLMTNPNTADYTLQPGDRCLIGLSYYNPVGGPNSTAILPGVYAGNFSVKYETASSSSGVMVMKVPFRFVKEGDTKKALFSSDGRQWSSQEAPLRGLVGRKLIVTNNDDVPRYIPAELCSGKTAPVSIPARSSAECIIKAASGMYKANEEQVWADFAQ